MEHETIHSDSRVLVAIVNRVSDLERARHEGWYRVPVQRAPRGLAAEYLAFYQTAVFGAERWAVRYVAPILQVSVATRRDLIPEEHNHPRAGERYYRLALGALGALPAPIRSHRLRRISFIPTTFGQLLRAHDVVDLWRAAQPSAADEVWGAGVNG
jgi:hypothetical protein